MGGNQTTVTAAVVAGALTVIVFWVLSFFAPEFMAAAPTGVESAVTTIFTALVCWFWPISEKTPPP